MSKITTPKQLKEAFQQVLLKFRNQAEANLGEADKRTRNQIDAVLSALMKELEEARHSETHFSYVQIGRLFDILRKVRDTAVIYNFFIDIFGDEAKKDKFLGAVREFGIGSPELIQMYLATYATACILSTELFKLILLFQIRGVSKVSDFNSIVSRLAPHNWTALEAFVDNKFRNALAHGMYTVEKGEAVLYKNTALEVYRRMTVQEFVMEVKNQNILFWSMLLQFLERMLKRLENFV